MHGNRKRDYFGADPGIGGMVRTETARATGTETDRRTPGRNRRRADIRNEGRGSERKKSFVICASGPSLDRTDAEKAAAAENCEKIVVNDNYRLIPNAGYLYAADLKWWRYHIDDVRAAFTGQLITQYRDEREADEAAELGLMAIKGVPLPGLGRGILHHNENSGAQAIGLAYLLGAEKIILIGFEMQNTGGRSHWFGDHPTQLCNGNYASYIRSFTQLASELKAEGVDVVNCSTNTALKQFRIGDLATELGQ
jgi:hypothetical protein